MSPHCCITSAFQAPSPLHWDSLAPSLGDPAEGHFLQLTPLPSIQLTSNFSLLGPSDLAHIFDSDSDNDDLLPSLVAVKDPVKQQQLVPLAVKQEQPLCDSAMGKCATTSSDADAGAAVALLKQRQSSSAQDHMRSYLAQLSDVQFTLRERAALAATIAAAADASDPGKHRDPAFDSDNSDEEDEDEQTDHDYSDPDEQHPAEYASRPAKRRSSFNLQGQNKSPRRDAGWASATAAAAQPGISAAGAPPGAATMPPQAPAAAADDKSFESTLQYLAQLSDVQARLHQNATLAATLHGPASPQRQQTSLTAAAPAGSNPSSPSRKRQRGAAAADVSTHVPAGTAAAGASVAVPQSSFKGVEYLPAEGKWQAYMYDSTVGEVVFLDKYEHELDAALAHDREMVKRLGPAAAAHQLNFSSSKQEDPLHAAALTAALAIQLGPFNSTGLTSTGSQPVAAAAAASSSSVVGPSERQRHAAAAVWAAAHEAQAGAAVPESRYKGVEYLPAEARWQAYMLDTNINQVVWLDKYADELSAAQAHDTAVINKLGAAAALAAGQINFTDRIPAAALQQQEQQGITAPRLSIAPLQLHGSTAAGGQEGDTAAGGGGGAAAAAAGDAASPANSPMSRGRGGGRAARGAQGAKPISQYKGVSWSSSCHKWAAVIWDRVSKKARHVGVYGSEEEAARAYDREVIATQGAKNTGLNFRDSVDLYRSEVGEPPAAAEGSAAATKHNSSEYRGVSWHERSKRWEARAWGSGRQHFVGSFSSAAEAARAYDKAILKLGGAGPKSASRLNFPLTDYDLQEIANMNFPVNNPNKKPPAKRSRKAAAAAAAAQDSDDE